MPDYWAGLGSGKSPSLLEPGPHITIRELLSVFPMVSALPATISRSEG